MHVSSEIESLRAQLAEVSAQRNASNRKIEELTDQLLATQAHTARVVEALETLLRWVDDWCETSNTDFSSVEVMCNAALSTPINLDALYEDRAQTLDGAAEIVSFISQDSSCQRAAERLGRVSAEYRAKKEK